MIGNPYSSYYYQLTIRIEKFLMIFLDSSQIYVCILVTELTYLVTTRLPNIGNQILYLSLKQMRINKIIPNNVPYNLWFSDIGYQYTQV